MASEAVRKILSAESESDKKLADARKLRDEMLDKASGNASLTIQKRLGEAAKESDRIRQEYSKKLETYRENAERAYRKKLEEISSGAEKNMDKAVNAVISEYF